jgi:hypothetical protein
MAGPSYIKNLYTEGIIEKKEIAFYLSRKNDSKFYFGGYPEGILKKEEGNASVSVNWIPLTGLRYWQVTLNDIQLSGESIHKGT